MLTALNVVNRANVDILLQVNRMSKDPFLKSIKFSGDSLLTLAPLLSAGLVKVASGQSSSSAPALLELALTERGHTIVDAWLAGDEAQYIAAQSLPQTSAS